MIPYRSLVFVHYIAFMVSIVVITVVTAAPISVYATQSSDDWRVQNRFHTFYHGAYQSPYPLNRLPLRRCLLQANKWIDCFPTEGSAFLFLMDVDDPAFTAVIAEAIGNQDEGLGAETVDDTNVVERIVSAISTVQVELAAREFEASYSEMITIDPALAEALAAAVDNQDGGFGAKMVADADVVEKIINVIGAAQVRIATQKVEALYSEAITTDPSLNALIADILDEQDKPFDSKTGASEAIVRTIQTKVADKVADVAPEDKLSWITIIDQQFASPGYVGPWAASRTNNEQLRAKDVLELIRQREEEGSKSFHWWPPTTVWAAGK